MTENAERIATEIVEQGSSLDERWELLAERCAAAEAKLAEIAEMLAEIAEMQKWFAPYPPGPILARDVLGGPWITVCERCREKPEFRTSTFVTMPGISALQDKACGLCKAPLDG